MSKLESCPKCGNLMHPEHPCAKCEARVMPVFTRTVDDELAAAKTRIAELEKALEPFALEWLRDAITEKIKRGDQA